MVSLNIVPSHRPRMVTSYPRKSRGTEPDEKLNDVTVARSWEFSMNTEVTDDISVGTQ